MRQKILVAVFFLFVTASAAIAQEQRGSIEGVVKDASGGVLPGVLIEVASPVLVGGANTVTGARGEYGFPALPPGIYAVTASLQGFATMKLPSIELTLGKTLRVDFAMTVAAVKETVVVSAQPPLIDITRSAVSTNITRKDFDLIPKGRDYSSVVTLAPGANAEDKLGGVSIDGASGAENVFYVDGMDVTQLTIGVSGKSVILDHVDDVQVKSSGYDAEFGGAIGGVVNVITRSGSNDLKGEVDFYFNGSALSGMPRPALRLGLTNSNIAELAQYPKDPATSYEPGFVLGGPIKRDRLWFLISYFPQLRDTKRTVTFLKNGQTQAFDATNTTQNLLAKLTAQLTSNVRGTFSYNLSPTKVRGTLPKQDGTDTPTFPFSGLGENDPNVTYSANIDYVATSKLYVGLRGGFFRTDQQSVGVPNQVNYTFNSSNQLLPNIPDNLRGPTGFSVVPTNTGTTRNIQTRLSFAGDATFLTDLAGRHTFKVGYQFSRLGSNVLFGDLQNNIVLYWGQAYTARSDGKRYQGTYGYYSWVQNYTEGNVHSNNLALYFQDSWRFKNRLTINAGIRAEREQIPSFNAKGGTAILWGFGDKIAPRIGTTLDVFGDGKWKIYGGYGKFYDVLKLNLPQNAFGGAHRLTSFYTLDTPDWPTLGNNNNWPGQFVETINGRPDRTGAIDPGIKPVQSSELSAGLEHQLTSNTSIGVRYLHKKLIRTIEDTGWVGASGSTEYIIGNPGWGQTVNVLQYSKNQGGFPAGSVVPLLPKAKRDYDAVEVRYTRRYANRWSANIAYTWSRLFGNYTGLVGADELSATGLGRVNPDSTASYDQAYNVFGPDAQGNCCSTPLGRHLPTDRPHQLKAQGIFVIGKGLSAGLNYYISSGTPVLRAVYKTNWIFYAGDLSDGRTPVYSQTDMNLQYQFPAWRGNRLQLAVNIANLFNQSAVVAKYYTINKTGTGISFTDVEFFGGQLNVLQRISDQKLQLDPRYMMPWFFQPPRTAVVSARFTF